LKTVITNILLIIGFSLPFLYEVQVKSDIKKLLIQDTTCNAIKSQIDSIDKQILYINEKTVETLTNNNKILQNTKEGLLRVGFCLDSTNSQNILACNNSNFYDTIENVK